MVSTYDIQKVIYALQEPSYKRNLHDLNILTKMLKQTKFFKERNLNDKLLTMLATEMEYSFCHSGMTVFEYGSPGDLLYFILEGSVEVLIPTGIKIQPAVNFASSLLLKAAKEKDGAHLSIKQADSPGIKNNFLLNIPVKIERHGSFIVPDVETLKYQQVAIFKSGDNFGELALITDKTRSASIKTLQDTHLALLKRSTFEKILKVIEQNKLDQLTTFFLSTPYFKNCKNRTMHKIQYYFTKMECIKDQIIYQMGDRPKYVYLIYAGEFQVKVFIPKKEISKKSLKNTSQEKIIEMKVKLGAKGLGRVLRQDKQIIGDTVNIKQMGVGQFFGVEDLIRRREHTATVKCTATPAILLRITASDFRDWVLRIPEVKQNFEKEIKLNYKLSMERIEEMRKFKEGSNEKILHSRKIPISKHKKSGVKAYKRSGKAGKTETDTKATINTLNVKSKAIENKLNTEDNNTINSSRPWTTYSICEIPQPTKYFKNQFLKDNEQLFRNSFEINNSEFNSNIQNLTSLPQSLSQTTLSHNYTNPLTPTTENLLLTRSNYPSIVIKYDKYYKQSSREDNEVAQVSTFNFPNNYTKSKIDNEERVPPTDKELGRYRDKFFESTENKNFNSIRSINKYPGRKDVDNIREHSNPIIHKIIRDAIKKNIPEYSSPNKGKEEITAHNMRHKDSANITKGGIMKKRNITKNSISHLYKIANMSTNSRNPKLPYTPKSFTQEMFKSYKTDKYRNYEPQKKHLNRPLENLYVGESDSRNFYVSNLQLIFDDFNSNVKQKSKLNSRINSLTFHPNQASKILNKRNFSYSHIKYDPDEMKNIENINSMRMRDAILHQHTKKLMHSSQRTINARENNKGFVMPLAFTASSENIYRNNYFVPKTSTCAQRRKI